MRDEFYGVFRELEDAYLSPITKRALPAGLRRPANIRLLRAVRNSVSEAEQASDVQLRPDARYFLIVNLHQMVALPLSHPKVKRVDSHMLQEHLTADVQTILDNVNREGLPQQEISGHAIVDSLSSVWSKLRTTRFEVWG